MPNKELKGGADQGAAQTSPSNGGEYPLPKNAIQRDWPGVAIGIDLVGGACARTGRRPNISAASNAAATHVIRLLRVAQP
jgi:hypothetical protein